MRIIIFSFIMIFCFSCKTKQPIKNQPEQSMQSIETVFEKDNNTTATYSETVQFYQNLAKQYSKIQVRAFGMTDSGHPLHEVIVTNDGVFDPIEVREKKKMILMVNNAIHPGEPCGVDASMMMVRDLMENEELAKVLNHTTIVIIPIYNISGHLNRGNHSRANQNGPTAYGFRGNARNLDLNRDFIKSDTENAKSFNQLFTKWSPDVFIDNHTSNGADYQYVMTLIPTQKDKMTPVMSSYLQENMLPDLFSKMKNHSYEMTPYVYARSAPDKGIAGFLDLPRYSSGYANLFNCFSFMPETHMLKPFKDRVWSTYYFMNSMLNHIAENKQAIRNAREKAIESTKIKATFDLNWKLDMESSSTVSFKGYTAKYKPSEISGQERLYYDRNDPYEKEIPFFNSYKSTLSVDKPIAYIIPRAYKHIIDKMKANGVYVQTLDSDKLYNVEIYRIEDFKTVDNPYEGHYLHRDLEVKKQLERIQYYQGDFLINVDQAANNYIVNTLEPQAPDSWFSWNFFDGILMQKEYFSPYVFEDLASDFLQDNPDIKSELEKKKMEDPDFAKNGYAQLEFVYKRSPYFEQTFRRYPVGRVIGN